METDDWNILKATSGFELNVLDVDSYVPLQITGTDGFMVSVLANGKIKIGSNYTPDEAARIFWEAMSSEKHRPSFTAPFVSALRDILKECANHSDGFAHRISEIASKGLKLGGEKE